MGVVISSLFLLLSLLIVPALVITTINGINKRANEAKQSSAAYNQGLGNVYTEKSGAYSLNLPKGWQTHEEARLNATIFRPGSDEDVSEAQVLVDKTPQNETLAGIVTKELADAKSEKTVIKSEKNIKIKDVKAHETVATIEGSDSSFEIYSVVLIKGGSTYHVTYVTSPDKINEYLPVFKAADQTFLIK